MKLHYWFKNYGNFAEGMDFSCWWSFIEKGVRMQSAQQACFYFNEGAALIKITSDLFTAIFYMGFRLRAWFSHTIPYHLDNLNDVL